MEEMIVTRCVKNRKEALDNFQIVTYEAPKKKKKAEIPTSKKINDVLKPENSEDERPPMDPRKKQELEMKKARFEVIKFGTTGLKKNKAREAKIALAISLGAKPQKNRKRNYKEILNEKKLEKAKEERRKKIINSGVTQSLRKPKRRRKFKKESGILGIYGKVQKDS